MCAGKACSTAWRSGSPGAGGPGRSVGPGGLLWLQGWYRPAAWCSARAQKRWGQRPVPQGRRPKRRGAGHRHCPKIQYTRRWRPVARHCARRKPRVPCGAVPSHGDPLLRKRHKFRRCGLDFDRPPRSAAARPAAAGSAHFRCSGAGWLPPCIPERSHR